MKEPTLSLLDKKISLHIEENKKDFSLINKVIFGDKEVGTVGMKDKVDEMHEILMNIKGSGKVINGVGSMIKYLMIVALVVAFFKGWLWDLITYFK